MIDSNDDEEGSRASQLTLIDSLDADGATSAAARRVCGVFASLQNLMLTEVPLVSRHVQSLPCSLDKRFPRATLSLLVLLAAEHGMSTGSPDPQFDPFKSLSHATESQARTCIGPDHVQELVLWGDHFETGADADGHVDEELTFFYSRSLTRANPTQVACVPCSARSPYRCWHTLAQAYR